MKIKEFADIVKMELAIRDIRRYQNAYIKANNNPDGIMVKYKVGWFAIGTGAFMRFVRPTEFRNMADRLEQRVKEGISQPLPNTQ